MDQNSPWANTAFLTKGFSDEERAVIQGLSERQLGAEHLAVRAGAAGNKFTYVESWKAIELANAIFGFDGWCSHVCDITPDFIEMSKEGRWRVGISATVRVTIRGGSFHEDTGYGNGEDKSKSSAIEKAKKEAVTDAKKRALRTFGSALGNCVYDKQHLRKVKSGLKNEATAYAGYDNIRCNPDNLFRPSLSMDPKIAAAAAAAPLASNTSAAATSPNLKRPRDESASVLNSSGVLNSQLHSTASAGSPTTMANRTSSAIMRNVTNCAPAESSISTLKEGSINSASPTTSPTNAARLAAIARRAARAASTSSNSNQNLPRSDSENSCTTSAATDSSDPNSPERSGTLFEESWMIDAEKIFQEQNLSINSTSDGERPSKLMKLGSSTAVHAETLV